jgi:hypothetical protein
VKSITLTTDETARWEQDGPEGEAFRRDKRAEARALSAEHGGATVDIFSDDGIVLDAEFCTKMEG